MYIFMVRTKINPTYKQEIIDYYLSGHLDKVVATACFESWTCEHDENSNELIVRYLCESQEKYQKYLTEYAPTLRVETQQKFPTQILSVERHFSEIIYNLR